MLPMWPVLLFILVKSQNVIFATQSCEIHDVKLEALWPKGFRASLPANLEVEEISFHGKVNTPFDNPSLQSGDGFSEALQLQDGVWFVQLSDLQLKPGDVVYYRLHVQVNGNGCIEDQKTWVVTSYANELSILGTLPATSPPSPPPITFNFPDEMLEVTHPIFRISIPDKPGITLFAFHGNVNVPIKDLEGGMLSRDIVKTTNGRWVFEDSRTELKPGDIVYYWLYVIVDGLGYRKDNQMWTVPRLSNTGGPSSDAFTFPAELLEVMHPKGLRVSIPDKPGITLFAFHGNVNVPMKDLGAGMMSRDIVKTTNGRWVFEDSRTELKPGDIVYYWLFVIVDGLGYRKDNRMWTVPSGQVPDPCATSVRIPAATLRILLPYGLHVSLPDRDGLKMLSFHGSLNEPLSHLRNGTIHGDAKHTQNDQWVFEDPNVCFKKGDVLRYWLYANIYNRDYFEGNLVWIVPGGDDGENQVRNCSALVTSLEPDLETSGLYSQPSLEETTGSVTL